MYMYMCMYMCMFMYVYVVSIDRDMISQLVIVSCSLGDEDCVTITKYLESFPSLQVLSLKYVSTLEVCIKHTNSVSYIALS